MKPLVSTIIPTFNRKQTLARAINSVLAQTYQDIELIIVDDGSNDGTQDFIKNNYPSINYKYQENRGVSSARNHGIKIANGEWIALLDSDDAWQPEKIEKQIHEVEQSDYKLCHTNETWIRNDTALKQQPKHEKKGGWIFEHCLPMCRISPSSAIIHSSIFEEIGLFDESLPACEDYDLWLRVTAQHPVLYLGDTLTLKYGGHDDQLSRKYWGMDRFRIYAIQKQLKSSKLKPEDHLAASNMLTKKIRIYLIGSRKRNKTEEVEHYERILEQYTTK